MNKICNKCYTSKLLEDFYKKSDSKDGLYNTCKSCMNKANNLWVKNHPNIRKKILLKYNNSTKALKCRSRYFKDNHDKIKSRKRIQQKVRLNSDPIFKLKRALRHRLYMAIKNKSKKGSAIKDLGCTLEHLKTHLESKFKNDMSWDNYGTEWHIDHIIPLENFNLDDRIQFLKVCNYTNLQPLWATTKIARIHGDYESIGNLNKQHHLPLLPKPPDALAVIGKDSVNTNSIFNLCLATN